MNTEWKPIESAPKDGTEVWAYNGEQARMRWTEGECYALWIWADDLVSDADPCPDQPTHWMPLPPAPTSHPIPTGATGATWRAAFDVWYDRRGVWPRLTYQEIFSAGWGAHSVSVSADSEDAKRWRMARTLFAVADIEDALAAAEGSIPDEANNAFADRAIDAAIVHVHVLNGVSLIGNAPIPENRFDR